MDRQNQDVFCEELSDLFNDHVFEMHNSEDNQNSLTALISSFTTHTNVEERLKIAQTLIHQHLPSISIIIVDEQLLKHLIPVLKDIYANLVKDVQAVAVSNEIISDKLHVLQNSLQMCITVLKMLGDILDCLLKTKQFALCDVRSVPLNTIEMLLVTFRHCKDSNTLYGGYSHKLTELLTIFKLADNVHKKLFALFEIVADASDEGVLLQEVLKFLVEMGEILACINVKVNAFNWKCYMSIAQKFSHILNKESFSIRQPLITLVNEIINNLKLMKKDNAQNRIRLCNFNFKVISKLCELFGTNTQEYCPIIYDLLHTCYRYYPPLLVLEEYQEDVICVVDSLIFSQVADLLRDLCLQPCFYQILEKVQPVAQNTLVFYAITFKVMSSLLSSHPEIITFGRVSAMIGAFFTMLERGHSEFWDVIIATADNKNSLYDDSVVNLADIICVLNEEEFNRVEQILFQAIFVECPWCSLLAVDIWNMVLRKENLQLSYETICNVIDQTKCLLANEHLNQPQLIFLKNFLQRAFDNLSPNYRAMLLDKYPLHSNLHVWKVFRFEHLPKTELVGIAAEIINVVHKTNSLIAGNCNSEEFQILCTGLDTVSYIREHSEIDTSHLILALFNLWKWVVNNQLNEVQLFKYFLQKLISATSNFLPHFSIDKLLAILNAVNDLLTANVNVQISTTSLLSTLTKGSLNSSLDRKQVLTTVSKAFHKLLTHKNPIINQNALEVFLQFSDNCQRNAMLHGAIKGGAVEKRISNFINNQIELGPLNTREYFKMQNKYQYVHSCNASTAPSESEAGRELETVVKRIKMNVELFHKLTNRTGEADENLAKIMTILNA
uniref:Uncharacterized protein n=2 Tax=Photinus pyralis TaxID=7054 RepID=A0A1Y1LCH9_PHOPY